MNSTYLKQLEKLKKAEIPLILKNFKKNFKVLLVYPNSYYIGMSNLGFQTIYKVLNSHSEISCERAFLPEFKVKPVSFETNTFPEFFDIIIFSISFEIDFFNVLTFLKLSGFPLYKDERKNLPVIAAGGIAVTLNYKPLSKFLDYFLIGEGEELIVKFVEQIITGGNPLNIDGVIGEEKEESKRICSDKIAHSIFSTKFTEFSDTFLIEIARGCKYSCNFCAASYNYSPYRIHRFNELKDVMNKYLKFFNKAGIVGSTVTSHPDFIKICSYLNNRNIPFSVTSLRLDSVSFEILDSLIAGKNRTFTVAVEAATDSLRSKINKKLTTEQIFEAISMFIEKKIINLKFYFIIGLPFESFDDVKEIVAFMEKVRNCYLNKKYFLKHLGRFIISINPFIPKANTPFYEYPMESEFILLKKLKFLKNNLKKIPNIQVKFENIYSAYTQGLFSKGDENIDRLIYLSVDKKLKFKPFFSKNIEVFKFYKVIQ